MPYRSSTPLLYYRTAVTELSDEDFELFLGDLVWQDTLGKLKQSRRESLGRVIKGSDYLSTRRLDMLLNQKHPPPSFPTLTSNAGSTSRPAGQNKCEKWFKDKGLIPSGSQLGTKAMPTASFAIALTMGFPSGWFEGLAEQYSKNLNTPSQIKPQAESEQDILQDEQLHQHKQRSPSAESSTSQKLLGGDEREARRTCVGKCNRAVEKLLEHKRGERSSLSRDIFIPCLVKKPKQP